MKSHDVAPFPISPPYHLYGLYNEPVKFGYNWAALRHGRENLSFLIFNFYQFSTFYYIFSSKPEIEKLLCYFHRILRLS